MAKLGRHLVIGSLIIAGLAACTTPEERQAAEARKIAPTATVMKAKAGAPIAEPGLPRSADGYPTFNAPLTAANVQIGDDEAAADQKKLTALAARRKSGAISEAEYNRRVDEMRKLAANHGSDTLSEINK